MNHTGPSILAQMRQRCRDNPHLEVTIENVMATYQCSRHHAMKCLKLLEHEALLEQVVVYRRKTAKLKEAA